jgi:hypothetical protein
MLRTGKRFARARDLIEKHFRGQIQRLAQIRIPRICERAASTANAVDGE